ncbi:MAG: heavy metal sensor histidine kinase [Piscirickettsiaceae bacterium]|nr:heavy metal sensor histidine kinase [Piscirickettsiaceae bacterium]
MKQPSSLTLRLTLLFSTVATLVLLSFGWLIERSIESHFELGDIKELKLITQALKAPLQTMRLEQNSSQIQQRFDDILIGHHHPLLRVMDDKGNTLYSSPELKNTSIDLPHFTTPNQEQLQQWQKGNNNYRIFTEQVPVNNAMPYTITVAISTDFHQRFLSNFRFILWLMIVSSIVVMSIMSWLAVYYGLRPLRQIINQLSHISSNELSTRLDPDTVPSELSDLIRSFNELLERLDKEFERLSHFSDDIAHELRTPVTNLVTQTQVALSRARSNEEYQDVLYSNMEEFDRLSQIISDMLFLAKTDNKIDPIEMEDVNLYEEVQNLFDYYEAWAEDNEVSLIVKGKLHLHCNRLMLQRALSNLLSNAIRHTPKDHGVTIQLEILNNHANIIVQNPGEPIFSKYLPKLFDRFYRVDPSRQRAGEGTGLGLAITKSIVEAHGGSIHVTSDESKTQFQITIPIQSPS